jgi:ankyrin repeat protein
MPKIPTAADKELILKAMHGNLKAVKKLIDDGADVNAATTDYSNRTSLMFASLKGHLEVARLLIKHGANVNAATTDTGDTSLMFASLKGHLEVVRLLIDKGANVNAAHHGMTSLMWTSYRGHLEVARLLIKNGANINARNHDGQTAIDIAEERGNENIVELLRKELIRNRARNVSSLMETIGNSEKVTEMGLAPPLSETTARERLPRNTLSHMASFLSGEKGNYQMQQKALREKMSRTHRAEGVGGSKKIRKTLRRKKSVRKTRRFR